MLATRLMGATSAAAAANIEYVGGRTFAFPGTTGNVYMSLSGTLTGGLDTSPSGGDLVIVYFGTGSNANRDLVVSGYTEITELFADDSYDTNLVVAYKVYSFGSEIITLTGGTRSTSDAGAVAIQVWRGVDTVTPLDVSAKTLTGGNTLLADFENITPVTSGAIILAGAAGAHLREIHTYSSSNLTGFISIGSDDTFDVTIGLGYHVWTSGSFTPNELTFSSTDSASFSYASCVLALRPA